MLNVELCIFCCIVETDENVVIEDLVDDFATFYMAGMLCIAA